MTDPALPQLLEAKAHSDKRQYSRKHMLLAAMMKRNPGAFVIDSDDGKGIVGITHVETGFRLHMPRQIIPVPLEKAALAHVAKAWNTVKGVGKDPLNATVRFLGRNPRVEEAVRKVTEYRLMDPRNMRRNMAAVSAVGGVTGAGAGAFVGDDWKERGRNSMIGALTGAGVGAGVGRYGPRLAQKGIGRVLTNVMEPIMYGDDKHKQDMIETLKNHGVKGIAKAVWNDKPLNPVDPSRQALFRDFFGLKRWDNSKNVFNQVGTLDDGTKLLKHNLRDAGGRADLREIHRARANGLTFGVDSGRWMQRGKTHNPSGGSLGGFAVKPNGQFTDTWDFALHPQEKITDVTSLLRAAVSPFGTPSTVVGRTLNESQALRFSKDFSAQSFNKIHPSFTQPVMDRAVNGAGLNRNEFMEYMRHRLNSGGQSPIMSAMGSRASGKPYNLLGNLAKSEGVSNSDMRVMLGGKPRATHLASRGAPKWDMQDLSAMYTKRIPGAKPAEVDNALKQLPADQMSSLRKRLTRWSTGSRDAGGEVGVLADVLGFKPDELPVLLG